MTFLESYVSRVRPGFEALLGPHSSFASHQELGGLAVVSHLSRPDNNESPGPKTTSTPDYALQIGISQGGAFLARLSMALGVEISIAADSKAGYLKEEEGRRLEEQTQVLLPEGNFTSVANILKWEKGLRVGVNNRLILSKIPDALIGEMITDAESTGATFQAELTTNGSDWSPTVQVESALATLGITEGVNPTYVNLTSTELEDLFNTTLPQPEPVAG